MTPETHNRHLIALEDAAMYLRRQQFS